MAEFIIEMHESKENNNNGNAFIIQFLVRCKDCKWWHESEIKKGYGSCGQANGITLKPSGWFCADGDFKEI